MAKIRLAPFWMASWAVRPKNCLRSFISLKTRKEGARMTLFSRTGLSLHFSGSHVNVALVASLDLVYCYSFAYAHRLDAVVVCP